MEDENKVALNDEKTVDNSELLKKFSGHKYHKIDSKDRISIPAKMRSLLGKEFVLSLGTTDSITLYPLDVWDSIIKKIDNIPNETDRQALRFFFLSQAEVVSLDGQGRIQLNDMLKKKANLLGAKEAAVFGNYDRVEIMTIELFEKRLSESSAARAVEIMNNYRL